MKDDKELGISKSKDDNIKDSNNIDAPLTNIIQVVVLWGIVLVLIVLIIILL